MRHHFRNTPPKQHPIPVPTSAARQRRYIWISASLAIAGCVLILIGVIPLLGDDWATWAQPAVQLAAQPLMTSERERSAITTYTPTIKTTQENAPDDPSDEFSFHELPLIDLSLAPRESENAPSPDTLAEPIASEEHGMSIYPLPLTRALTATPTPSPQPSSPPLRIAAPAIGLDSRVIPVGWRLVEQDGQQVSVWEVADYAAGWHINSAVPGQQGNIVISGHNNIRGEVFRDVVDLEPGDTIILETERSTFHYIVESKFIVLEKNASPQQQRENARWIGEFPDERLTLITCWPYTSNTHRVIVIAKPAPPAAAHIDDRSPY